MIRSKFVSMLLSMGHSLKIEFVIASVLPRLSLCNAENDITKRFSN